MSASSTPMTPRLIRAIERAAGIARARGPNYMGTGHMLLSFLEDTGTIAREPLADEDEGSSASDRLLATEDYNGPPSPES